MNTSFSPGAAVILALFAAGCERTDPEQSLRGDYQPFDRDHFSGKDVVSMEMAHDLIDHREKNAPLVGETAPEFEVIDVDSRKKSTLAELHRERPVVLVFSSRSCQVFGYGLESLLRVYSGFSEQAEFAMIYIREAHPGGGMKDTKPPRTESAADCRRDFKLPFPIYLDSDDDRAATRWAAWPTRLFVVDTRGVVIFAAPSGPWGFRPTSDFQHGDGTFAGWDLNFSRQSLEDFLGNYFGKAPTASATVSDSVVP